MTIKYIGFGAALKKMFGCEQSDQAVRDAIGLTITGVTLDHEDTLRIAFAGSELHLADEGQSCCEKRYMRTDDDLSEFVGARFLGVEVKDAPSPDGDGYNDHEVQFLEIRTDRGSITMASHNEHNGYYGGFALRARIVPPKEITE